MNLYLSLPLLFLRFWFFEAPISLIKFFFSVNHATVQIMSLPLLIRTFFKPLKNEYRKGLVGFSIVFGIILKSAFIFADLILFMFILLIEMGLILLFITWPFLSVYLLFI